MRTSSVFQNHHGFHWIQALAAEGHQSVSANICDPESDPKSDLKNYLIV